MLNIIILVIGVVLFLFAIYACIISFFENEKLAAVKLFVSISVVSIILSLPFFINLEEIFSQIILLLFVISIIVILLPINNKKHLFEKPKGRIDERNVMFSRAELVEGTKNYNNYYDLNPEKFEVDNKFRENPGLLSKKASKYNPFMFAMADASFFSVESFKNRVDGQISDNKVEVFPQKASEFIINHTLFAGAKSCGKQHLKNIIYIVLMVEARNMESQ